MKLEISISWVGTVHVRLVGANGEILMHSETYYKLSNAKRAAKRLSRQLGVPIK